MRIETQAFFNAYSRRFGPLRQRLVDSLSLLITTIESDERFGPQPPERSRLAYCLATFKWETAHRFEPIDEYGTDDYFNKRYGPHTRVGKSLGNIHAGDGAKYHGRGYVQLTGRDNYSRAGTALEADLVAEPGRAKTHAIAYEIAVRGMHEGWFTRGQTLSKYFRNGTAPDYEGARRIVNGNDKAQTIASYARLFDEVLAVSLA